MIIYMLKDINGQVLVNWAYSELFECTVGVSQGENLSPFLSSVYLKDLEEYICGNNFRGCHTF